jgi:predicted DNA binding CopG/RHH family protein
VTFREEHRLRVFENTLLRSIFDRKEQDTGENNTMRSFKAFTAQYLGGVKSRNMRLAGHMACMWAKRNSYMVLVEKSEVKRPLGIVGIDWMIRLKWISKKRMGQHGLDYCGLR